MASPRGPLGSLRALALAAVLVLAGTACGGDGDSDDVSDTPRAESSAGEPAESPSRPSSLGISDAPEPEDPCVTDAPGGDQASGVGFALTPPDGWSDVSDQLTAALTGGNVSGIAWADRAGASGGFADNLNVIVTEDSGVEDIGQLRDQFSTELRQVASDVEPREDVEVACEIGLRQTATTTQQGRDLVYDQVVTAREGTTYLLTMTYAAETPARERQAILQGLLGSWKWLVDE